MILLTCMDCTTAEAFKIHATQTLVNNVTQSVCFDNEMRKLNVPYGWIDRVQNANIKIPLYYYFEDTQTIGYMNPGSPNVYLNRKFHNTMSKCRVGSNIAHELTHLLGYRHVVDVAYATNFAFEQCCQE